ncbi:hypothetical protein EMCRGX_G012244 [Ephydatia muelleri]
MRIHVLTMLLCSMTTTGLSVNVISCTLSNTSTSTHISLTQYRCLDTTSMTTTCTTYDSDVLVLYFNGHQVLLYLSSSVGENVTYVNITRGVICIAYKVWVDEANRTIMSEITCTGLGGLSEPLNISCMSDDDRAGVCSDVLECTSCATPTSIPSMTTPPASRDTGATVGGVVGALILTIIVIIIIVKVTAIICRKCGGRQVNLDITPVSGHVSNATELLDNSENAAGPTRPEESTLGRPRVSPATATLRKAGDYDTDKYDKTKTAEKPYITGLEGTENQNTSTVLKRDDSAGTGDGHHAPKPGDPSDPAPKPGDPSDPAPKPGDPSDPALETERFTANGEECTQVIVKTECVFSRGPANKNTPSGTTAIQDTGHSDTLLYTEVPKAIGSQPNPPYAYETQCYEAEQCTTLAEGVTEVSYLIQTRESPGLTTFSSSISVIP